MERRDGKACVDLIILQGAPKGPPNEDPSQSGLRVSFAFSLLSMKQLFPVSYRCQKHVGAPFE